ncbi:MAG: hypothetical protein EHM55_13215 [Acidobacteria bacterium]|nr:MAG: hypothetical protein EHM55_13215 [Acidobacteriota bacterium]
MDVTLTVVLVIAAMLVGGAVAWYLQQQRSRRLRDRFGPEYDRARAETGDVRRAEANLAAREQRVEKLHIRALSAPEAARFGEVWRHVQTLFVDDPRGAIKEADHLVNEVMTAKGFPMADFEQRAADISVDHPRVVEHYRAARAIAGRSETNTASTEDLRQAVIHYRTLFEDLLEQKPSELKPVHARR